MFAQGDLVDTEIDRRSGQLIEKRLNIAAIHVATFS
jgi:hypothetical protein